MGAASLESPRMEQLELSCWDAEDKPSQAAGARWVRLTGKTCQYSAKAEGVQVRNLTNGYVATVFAPIHGRLTTDYIPLEAGKNELLLRFDQVDGVSL